MKGRNEFFENDLTKLIASSGQDLKTKMPLEKHCTLDIDNKVFYDYMYENWTTCNCQPYDVRPNMDDLSNKQMSIARELGYHSGNTLKRDWGRHPEENLALCEMLGNDNIKLLGIDPNRTLIRLLCYMPGNFLPVHVDGTEAWQQYYKTTDVPKRFSVLVNDWSWGQFLQIHNNVLTNWNVGDTYVINKGVWHCSGNAGILPKVTLTITGS